MIPSPTRRKIEIGISFRWYDLWIGAYINRDDRVAYVCLIPMFPIRIKVN